MFYLYEDNSPENYIYHGHTDRQKKNYQYHKKEHDRNTDRHW